MRYIPFISNGMLPSTIIIIGHVLAIVINALLVLLYILLALSGKWISKYVPSWLVAANFLFFIFQVILLIK